MKILFLGAGGVGGYFGGRLLQVGADVCFLVREGRARQLERDGLVVKSSAGDFAFPVRTITAARPGFDLVILTNKAYDLDSALEAIAPAMTADTAVLPLLNGVRHFERLDERFGAERVMRGLCGLATTLTAAGHIVHTSPFHFITWGERDGRRSARATALLDWFAKTPCQVKLSDNIYQDVWEKYYYLVTLAAMNCLLRGNVGEINATDDGGALLREMLAECAAVARAEGYPPSAEHLAASERILTERGSKFNASMLRDLEKGGAIESEHLVGDLLERAKRHRVEAPLLCVANCHLQVYEARRRAATA
jgi:2-dehydropantoate 2-reductase